jgi:putative ABC transport system permease protein
VIYDGVEEKCSRGKPSAGKGNASSEVAKNAGGAFGHLYSKSATAFPSSRAEPHRYTPIEICGTNSVVSRLSFMLADFVYAARTLRASPTFAAASVLTLALGIGASTAIFSVAETVLLRPLPYKDPGRLIYACTDLRKRNVYDYMWSTADLLDLREHASSALQDAAGVNTQRIVLQHDDGSPEELAQAVVTTNLFRVLGARVVLGRDFTDSDALPQPPSANGQPLPPDRRLPQYGVISYSYFQRQFGGNPAILGKPLAKGGAIVVGVLEPGVQLFFRPDKNVEQKPDIWLAQRVTPGEPRIVLRWRVIARLRPGATLERAQAQADAVAAQSRALEPTYQGADLHFRLEPMQRYLTSQARPAILALMGAAIFLLLIACSNVANLFLVRTSLRGRDLAVRTALGASWWRLARQMLAEALFLGTASSVLGSAVAWVGLRNLLAIAPANLPRRDTIVMDATALAFSIVAGFGAALIFALAPAWRAARPDCAQVLRASGRNSGLAGGSLARNLVIVSEVALCFVLLIGSGLMVRSFIALSHTEPGFDARHIWTLRTVGGKQGARPEEGAAIVHRIHDTLASIPGVESVTAANVLPLNGTYFPYRWGTAEAEHDESKYQAFDVETVLPGYFQAMHTPLVAGREFEESDNHPGLNRIVVDEMLAAKAFPNGNAVGQRILSRFLTVRPEWFEIIGVAAHQHLTSLSDTGREQGYLPDGFWGHQFVADWALRTRGDPARYAAAARSALARLDRTLLITHQAAMDDIVTRAQTSTRFSLELISAFAAIAALLAGVGLYGVLSTVVRQRTAEIGIRLALGASPSGIFSQMIGYGLRLIAAGIVAGLLAAFLLTRVMASMLVGVKPTDPLTFAVMAFFFLAIAVFATWIPAYRAASLDPNSALREQ